MSWSDNPLINEFLDEPVPPSGTVLWQNWHERGRSLPPAEAVPAFIEALKQGSESQQYAALLGLRLFGFSAFAEGYGSDFIYRLKAPGASVDEVIKPKHLPEPYEP